LSWQPFLNALLNSASAACAITGWVFIRKGRRNAHKRAMLSATAISALFLINYVVYHATHGHTSYSGSGIVRSLYFIILITHTLLAIAIVPLVGLALYYGWTSRLDSHRRVARFTLPVWLYVSVTGVVIYVLLYG